MSKKVHILIPNTTKFECGAPHAQSIARVREQVTCKVCKRSPRFKTLPNLKMVKKLK